MNPISGLMQGGVKVNQTAKSSAEGFLTHNQGSVSFASNPFIFGAPDNSPAAFGRDAMVFALIGAVIWFALKKK